MQAFLLRLNGDYQHLVREHFAQPYVDKMAESELLPEYVKLTPEAIVDIARKPQQSIPYLT